MTIPQSSPVTLGVETSPGKLFGSVPANSTLNDLTRFAMNLGRASTSTHNPRVAHAVEELKALFAAKLGETGEIWVVSHKADLPQVLLGSGALPNRDIDVAHVAGTLGVKANRVIPSFHLTYTDYISTVNSELAAEVNRLGRSGNRAVVFMTFPNAAFSQLTRPYPNQFILTAAIPDIDDFLKVENKVTFGKIMTEIIAEHPDLADVLPKWTSITDPSDYRSATDLLTTPEGSCLSLEKGFFAQAAFSGAGAGTRHITSEEDWASFQKEVADGKLIGPFKMTEAVNGAPGHRPYAANGTGCIIPTSDGECVVYVDPLSHKPTGSEELRGNLGEGVGNDWSHGFSEEITAKYYKLTQVIGKYLWDNYKYVGIFGPDCLIGVEPDGTRKLQITEINPRTQGTTPYQTLNSFTTGRVPLDFLHYVGKLSNDNLPSVECIRSFMGGTPEECYADATNVPGGFYLKIPGPSESTTVKETLSGPYLFNVESGTITKLVTDGPPLTVDQTWVLGREFAKNPIQGGKVVPIYIKAPRQGDIAEKSITATGYITGYGFEVFEPDIPVINPAAARLHKALRNRMYGTNE